MADNRSRAALLLSVLLASCGSSAAPDKAAPSEKPQPSNQHGYAGLELGSSFEETLGKLDTRFYRPEDLAVCSNDMPLKGCTLIWNNWVVPFERKNGVPYGLNLSFDKNGALDSITLHYSRRADDISSGDCLAISEKTAGWLQSEYGQLVENQNKIRMDDQEFMSVRTKDIDTQNSQGLNVFFVATFIANHCDINVSFGTKVGNGKPG